MECGGASGRAAFCKRGHSGCYATRLHALLCQRDARTMLHANFEIGSELRAFELADEVAVLIYRATRGFPKEEVYGLTSQMRRAAVSMPSTIVEGCSLNNLSSFETPAP